MPKGSPLTQTEIAEVLKAIQRTGGNKKQAAGLLGLARSQLYKRLQMAHKVKEEVRRSKKPSMGQWEYRPLKTRRPRITPDPATAIAELEEKAQFSVEHTPELGTSKHTWEIKSDKQNRYKFAAFGDLHAASKYCRWDVRGDLTKQAEDFGATAIFDAGNWCDGEMSFNRYDLEAVGMDPQLQVLARNYPKTKIPTYAITGADHEGWWIRREGVDVGRYCESIMRDAGHAWTNLGYLEADVVLVNANSGQRATLRVMHAGGGSAYAISYKPQKILESLEGGEKPSVVLIGHYHKLDSGLVRNTWYAQVGCQQDQTPFMRQRSLEAHVGGILLEMEQDPKDGSISGFKPDMRRYFAKAYYFRSGQANQRWSGHGPIREVPRGANIKG